LRSGIFLAGKTIVHVAVKYPPTSTLAILLQLPCLKGGVLPGVECGDSRIDGRADGGGVRAFLSYYSRSHFDLL
jgi:hypothetical protein